MEEQHGKGGIGDGRKTGWRPVEMVVFNIHFTF